MRPHQNPLVEEIIARHRRREASDTVNWLGHNFTIAPGVFSPFIAPSGSITRCLASLIDFRGKTVWEVGCGAGIFACSAALSGATSVLATDISVAAIDNTKENAVASHVENKITVRLGPLFDPIVAGDVFDIVYADLPLVDKPANDDLEKAFYEAGLKSLKELPARLQEFLELRNGEVYVCLSNLAPKEMILAEFRANHFYGERVLEMDVLRWVTLELFKFKPCHS
jgi:methylase of polypeptide subunit release factors